MQKTKVAITLDAKLLGQLDALVDEGRFPNRSQAIESAITDKLDRIAHRRLALECSKLDREQEQSLADEGLASDGELWPEY